MVACPYCQQDYVWEINIRELPGPLFMCLECDTVWVTSDEISDKKGQNFEDFMTQRGRTPDWKVVTKLRRANEE
jgi:hypothetical protein